MKYYSKSPKELQEYIEARNEKAKATARSGRRLLVANIALLGFFFVLVFFIVMIFGMNKKTSSHEFHLHGWDVTLACQEKRCQTNFQRSRVSSVPPTFVIWQRKQNDDVIDFTKDKPQTAVERSWNTNFDLSSALTKKDKVFIQIFYGEDEFSFRVFP